jgi:hypothetical protein
MAQERKKKAVAILGLVTGAGQIILGAVMMPEEKEFAYRTNESEKDLSMVNIGSGAVTMILSYWNLVTTPESNNQAMSWNIYPYSIADGNVGFGLSITRGF